MCCDIARCSTRSPAHPQPPAGPAARRSFSANARLTRLCETLLVISAYKRLSGLAHRRERDTAALLGGIVDRFLVTAASLSPLAVLYARRSLP